jgi:hypothetical protein
MGCFPRDGRRRNPSRFVQRMADPALDRLTCALQGQPISQSVDGLLGGECGPAVSQHCGYVRGRTRSRMRRVGGRSGEAQRTLRLWNVQRWACGRSHGDNALCRCCIGARTGRKEAACACGVIWLQAWYPHPNSALPASGQLSKRPIPAHYTIQPDREGPGRHGLRAILAARRQHHERAGWRQNDDAIVPAAALAAARRERCAWQPRARVEARRASHVGIPSMLQRPLPVARCPLPVARCSLSCPSQSHPGARCCTLSAGAGDAR